MYRKQVRRRRAVLALLIVGSFVLLTITYGQGSERPAARRQHDLQPGPVGRRPGAEARPRPGQLVRRDLRRARRKQPAARRTGDGPQAGGRRPGGAGRKTRSCASWSSSTAAGAIPSGYEPVTGRVIARSPTVWYSDVTIDVGSGDGVARRRPGDQRRRPGRHASPRSTGGSAQVTLITDHASAVSAKVVPARRPGRDQARSRRPRRPDPRLHRLDQARPRRPGRGHRRLARPGARLALPAEPADRRSRPRPRSSSRRPSSRSTCGPSPTSRNLDLVQVLTGGSRG